MRFSIYKLLLVFLLGCPLGVFAQVISQSVLTHSLKSHFANHFNVEVDDIHLRMIHKPKQLPKQPYSIFSQRGIRLGHQTLWLVKDDSKEKFAVTIDVSIDLPVLTALRKISRRSELNQNNVRRMVKRINLNANQYLTSFNELNGMMAVQVLRSGDGITQNMIRPKLDMNRGDDVTVQIVSGDFVIETSGKVRKDGRIGDNTQVLLTKTGKRITGKIISHKLVKIDLN